MELDLKKRILGFFLLAGFFLAVLPLFVGKSIPVDDLKLSVDTPRLPGKPLGLSQPLPKSPEAELIGAAPLTNAIPSSGDESDSKIELPVPGASAELPALGVPPASSSTQAPQPLPTPDVSPSSAVGPEKESAEVAPVVKKTPALSPESVGVASNTSRKSSHPPTQPVATSKTRVAQPTPSAKLPDAWVVQVGSFLAKSNVDAMVKRLQSAGFTAYIRPLKTEQGYLLRVLVGPVLDRQDALQLKRRLQELGISSIVLRAGA